MLRLFSDQKFSEPILRRIFRGNPEVDIVPALDVGLDRAADPVV